MKDSSYKLKTPLFPINQVIQESPCRVYPIIWMKFFGPDSQTHKPSRYLIITILGEFFLIKILMVRLHQGPEEER